MKKFGKMMAAAAMAVSCLAISIPGYAAYSLSEEVKAPTPALKQASEIGSLLQQPRPAEPAQ